MSARETIFSAIQGSRSASEDRQTQARSLLAERESLHLTFPEGLEQRFVSRVTSPQLTGTLDFVEGPQGILESVARYRAEHHLHNHRLSLFADIDAGLFHAQDIATTTELDPNESMCLTEADLGVAETGSLVFLSGAGRPTLSSYLPLHHLILLKRDRLVGMLDDIMPALGLLPLELPRNVNLVTGTSGTADIEAKNVRGAHGPRFLHVMMYR